MFDLFRSWALLTWQISPLRQDRLFPLSVGTHLTDVAPMLPSDLDSLTTIQRLVVEQSFVMAQELESAADSAPDGHVIDRCESLLLGNGRDFLRRVLELTLQSRAELLEKRGCRPNLSLWRDGAAQRELAQDGDDRAGCNRRLACLFRLKSV